MTPKNSMSSYLFHSHIRQRSGLTLRLSEAPTQLRINAIHEPGQTAFNFFSSIPKAPVLDIRILKCGVDRYLLANLLEGPPAREMASSYQAGNYPIETTARRYPHHRRWLRIHLDSDLPTFLLQRTCHHPCEIESDR